MSYLYRVWLNLYVGLSIRWSLWRHGIKVDKLTITIQDNRWAEKVHPDEEHDDEVQS